MFHLRWTLPSFAAAALFAIGCGSPNPASPGASQVSLLEQPLAVQDQLVAGVFNLTLDPAALTATLTPRMEAERSAQFQALNFDLDIANFQKPDTLRIVRLAGDVDDDLQLVFRHSHPFAAPNLLGNPTAQNRADLGYTGRLLIVKDLLLSEVPDHIFFDDGSTSIVADTRLVKNADGYVNPGTLLQSGSLLANTHPYVLLADEAKNNRIGISNGGNPQGNYGDTAGGWQRPNLGPNGNGWTGFDYIHAGQTVENSFTLRRDALSAGPVSLQLALLIKYSQPSGAPPRTNRQLHFPQEPINVANFAYRLPFAALDASKATVTNPDVAIDPGIGSTAEVDLILRDWDSKGIEHSSTLLAGVNDVTLIQPGASGQPTAFIDIPALSNTPFPLLPTTTLNSGEPGDEIPYNGTMTNTLGTAGEGTYPGLVRFVDPEDGDPSASLYRYGSDPDTLQADPTRALQVRTYQHVPVRVGNPAPVVLEVTLVPGAVVNSGQTLTASVVTDVPVTGWNWDFGGGAVPNTSTSVSPVVIAQSPGLYTGTVVVSNANGSSDPPFEFTYQVTPPQLPTWSTHTIDDGGGTVQVGRFPSVTPYGSGYAVVYGVLGTGEIPRLAVSSNPNPTAPADWTIMPFDTGTGNSAIYNAITVHDNRIYIAYYAGTGFQSLRMARSGVALPAAPGSFTNWDLDTSGNAGLDLSMTETAGGRLLVIYRRTTPTPAIIRAAIAPGTGPTNATGWSVYDAAAQADAGGTGSLFLGSGLPLIDGKPAFVFLPSGTGFPVRGPWAAIATTSNPITSTDWTHHNIFTVPANVTHASITAANDRLAVGFGDNTAAPTVFRMALASALLPASSSDWTSFILDTQATNTGHYPALGVVNDRLFAAHYTVTSRLLRVARALSQEPTSVTDWQTMTVITGDATLDPGNFGSTVFPHMSNPTVIWVDNQDRNVMWTTANYGW